MGISGTSYTIMSSIFLANLVVVKNNSVPFASLLGLPYREELKKGALQTISGYFSAYIMVTMEILSPFN